jgi:hypothetical protein
MDVGPAGMQIRELPADALLRERLLLYHVVKA